MLKRPSDEAGAYIAMADIAMGLYSYGLYICGPIYYMVMAYIAMDLYSYGLYSHGPIWLWPT